MVAVISVLKSRLLAGTVVLFSLLDVVGSGVKAAIRVKVTGITIGLGIRYETVIGCGVTVDTRFRIGITKRVRPVPVEHVALGYNDAIVLLDQNWAFRCTTSVLSEWQT